ncbi:MAG: hypothetical protein WC389_22545 [Lutibacter sp.]|jgi:hypothetical protein
MSENKIGHEALNEKLLKFIGFKYVEKPLPKGRTWKDWYIENYPAGNPNGKCFVKPDVVNSLDLQHRWIYPKLAELNYEITKHLHPNDTEGNWRITLFALKSPFKDAEASDENEAVAFALACEKLIDELEEK